MSGVDLASLESEKMLDVLHFMMEEDMLTEFGEAKSDMRVLIYRELYGREYPTEYRFKKQSNSSSRFSGAHSAGGENPYGDLSPVDPVMESKAYVPPTPQSNDLSDPFSGVLDAPL